MSENDSARGATERWRASVERVIEFAEVAAPLSESGYGDMAFDDAPDPRTTLDDRVTRMLDDSKATLRSLPDTTAQVSILLADLEVAHVLMTASQEPDDVFSDFGLQAGAVIRFDEARVQVSVLQDAALGVVEASPRVLPKEVAGELDELQNAGGEELVGIAKSPITWAAVVGGGGAVSAFVANNAPEAFQQVKAALTWLKKAAMRVIEWVTKKLRNLLPEAFREKFDEIWDKIKDNLKDSASTIVGAGLGLVLGRSAVEEAWLALPAEQSKERATTLADVTAKQLSRIGYVTVGRNAVDKWELAIVPVLTAAGLAPQIKIVALAIVVAVVGFVGYQVWDGFEEIKRLA